ncbi:hypothetical protein CC80DRAFT_588901 [Byssothecium circinans]|uniref:Uncharacterized protein n=1 Tax=Byssothecium circinans TaxID=147558 RepID=A0A6A5UBS0_9PLEO|nr:hypothetical protein CC80DRAFT_588901 [Byssothecium circinans]
MPSKAARFMPTVAPPREAIAFALAIVKATPAGMSAKDYALKLRDHLRPGQLDLSDSEKGRYLDVVSYQQQRIGDLEKQIRELQAQNIQLERMGWLNIQDDTAAPASTGKRKRTAPPHKSSRVKPVHQPGSVEESMEVDFNILEGLGEDGTALMEQTWTFQKLLRHPDSDPKAVCSSLVGMTRALGRVVSQIARCYDRLATRTISKPNLTAAHDKSELSCAILVCSRIFAMILFGLESLNDDSPGTRLPGLVVFECVNTFSTALDAIELSARQSVMTATSSTKKTPGSKSDSLKDSLAARGIAQFLRTVIGALEKDHPLHQDLFDGFAFVLFERVSKRLYYTVFGRHRSATIEGDMTALPSNPADRTRQEMESLAIRLEVKALMLILERVMDRAPNHMNPTQSMNRAPTKRTLSFKNLPASRTRLSPFAKDRLQRTLVACMFGDKVDDPLKDLLTKPAQLAPLPALPKVTDKTVEEWYQDRVWELVGWDIMARETEWMDGRNARR